MSTQSQVEQIKRAAERLATAQSVACLTGAGVSAESGIATFRDAQSGLWSRFDPAQLASRAGFTADPGLVWRWYMERLNAVEAATPNAGHYALAALAQHLPRFTLITQNVDDLHERAGHSHVLHLHGHITQYRCNRCSTAHPLQQLERDHTTPPRCAICGDRIRPDVVWFGENLPAHVLDAAWRAAEQAEIFLVIGTSGTVYPAAQLPRVAKQQGAVVIDVNPDRTSIAGIADHFLQGTSAIILPQLVDALAF